MVAFTQVAVALVNPDESSNQFSDVKPGDWYTSSLTRMMTAGIIKGYSDGTFGPGNSVNRAEVVVMLDRMRAQIHKDNDDIRFVICYGTSAQPSEQLSTEDQARYEDIKNNFCGDAKGELIPGYSW